MYKICLSLAFMSVFATSSAFGQYPVVFVRGGYRAATVAESHAYGLSSLIRSRAHANLTNSKTALTFTEVRSRQLDNQLKTADTYFQMRAVYRHNQFGTPEEKAARRAENQERYFRYSQLQRPKRTNSQQVDSVTGKIKWPLTLMNDQYTAHRDAMQELFAQRAKKGGYITYDEYTTIEQTSDEMLAALKGNIKNISGNDYSEGKNFINVLVYEAKHGNTTKQGVPTPGTVSKLD